MEPVESRLRERSRGWQGGAAESASQRTAKREATAAEAGRVDDEVLADLSHELRNQFHKLYYCAELLRSPQPQPSLDAGADLLERTVQSLEEFLTGALDYFRPVQLQTVHMTGGDLGRALDGVLRAVVADARVDVTVGVGAETTVVAIDPGRLSMALRAVAGRLAPAGQSASQAFGLEARLRRARRTDVEVLEIRIEIPASLGALADDKKRLVDWALAAKVLAAHGGGLVRDDRPQQGPGCTLWIPLVDEAWTRRS